MAMMDLSGTAFAAYAPTQQNEAKRFLESAAALIEIAQAPAAVPPSVPIQVPPLEAHRTPTTFLDDATVEEQMSLLRVRGIKLQAVAKIVGAKKKDGTIIIFALSGSMTFKGPLPTLSTCKQFDWSGIAEKIEIPETGDAVIININGVYGSVKDGASTRILVGMDDTDEAVVRSIDKDPKTNQYRSLSGKYYFDYGHGRYQSSPPYEVRIGMDKLYGIYQIEKYSEPCPILVGKAVHENVVLLQHRPSAGLVRVETQNAPGEAVRVYHVPANT